MTNDEAERALDIELEQLREQFERSAPHIVLRPGLSDAEIDELEARLSPYRLPADVRALYRWANGAEDCLDLFFDAAFPSLARALDVRDGLLDVHATDVDPSWIPSWFPLTAQSHQFGELVTLEPRHSAEAGWLWNFHYHDPVLSPSYVSVLHLVATSRIMWSRAAKGQEEFSVGEWNAARREADPDSEAVTEEIPDVPRYFDIDWIPE